MSLPSTTGCPLPEIRDLHWSVTAAGGPLGWTALTNVVGPGGHAVVFHGNGDCADVAIHEAHRALVRYWRAAERAAETEAKPRTGPP